MIFPFSVSIGDFIAGIKFIRECVEAVDDASGATSSHHHLTSTLDAISLALTGIDRLDLQGCLILTASY
jgi:hypothetical protein